MEEEFKEIEKKNGGYFPISNFELILKKINIIPKLIHLISSYFKKKTQKSFIDFENFKYLIMKFSESYDDLIEILFKIISYPKEYINRKDMKSIIKSFSLTTNSNQLIEDITLTDKITLEKFKQISKYMNNDLCQSLEKIQYIPYIYFKIPCNDKTFERNCIEVLMKGNKDLKGYITEETMTEKDFYIVDMIFWEDFCNYIEWNSNLNNKEVNVNDNGNKSDKITIEIEGKTQTDVKEMTEDIDNNLNKPRINTTLISDENGKLNPGLVYFKDYVILTEKYNYYFNLIII
jgi:hypothetical protein